MPRRASLLATTVAVMLAAAPSAHAADGVVALFDTGINPYHKTFRDRSARAYKHPSTYLAGYPKDAQALDLTLDAKDYWAAVKADCERVWKHIEPGKLYWIPGTKIVGAITFSRADTADCPVKDDTSGIIPRILDVDGHGTMTASRAASTEYGACHECRIVEVQWGVAATDGPEVKKGIDWMAANARWIDAESHSWDSLVPGWEPTGAADQLVVSSPGLVREVEMASKRHLFFHASGNGVATRGGVLGHPTILDPGHTPSQVIVGGIDSGYMNVWPGFPPHVVSDSCASWAAHVDSMTSSEDTVGSGTSAATPFAAGGAVRMLIEARSILGDRHTGVRGDVVARGPAGRVPSGPIADGVFTIAEWHELVLKTASPRPKAQFEDGPPCNAPTDQPYGPTPVKWEDVPPDYPEYFTIGYGAVDNDAQAIASRVLHGQAPMPDRARTDQFFAVDAQARSALYGAWSLGQDEPGPAMAPDYELEDEAAAAPGSNRRSARRTARKVAIGKLAALPAARGCVSPRRGLRLTLRAPAKLRSARVLIGGRRMARLSGRALRRAVVVRPLPHGRFVLRLETVDGKGHTFFGTRGYRSCSAR